MLHRNGCKHLIANSKIRNFENFTPKFEIRRKSQLIDPVVVVAVQHEEDVDAIVHARTQAKQSTGNDAMLDASKTEHPLCCEQQLTEVEIRKFVCLQPCTSSNFWSIAVDDDERTAGCRKPQLQ